MNPIAQRGETDCSPTAIVNAICWAKNWRYKEDFQVSLLERITKLCKTNEEGTDDKDFERVLKSMGRKYGFKIDRQEKCTPKRTTQAIIKHLSDGGAIALCHLDLVDPVEWHFSFWFAMSTTGCLMGANVLGSMEFYACPPEGMEAIIRISKTYWNDGVNFPEVYFLSKVSK